MSKPVTCGRTVLGAAGGGGRVSERARGLAVGWLSQLGWGRGVSERAHQSPCLPPPSGSVRQGGGGGEESWRTARGAAPSPRPGPPGGGAALNLQDGAPQRLARGALGVHEDAVAVKHDGGEMGAGLSPDCGRPLDCGLPVDCGRPVD